MFDFKRRISSGIPWLPAAKRNCVAVRDAWIGSGGSQCGEDRWLLRRCEALGIDLATQRYIEVGANQPTQLSNTWQLYRRGASGLLVEPDPRCANLLRRWRSRDIVVPALAGERPGCQVLALHTHTTMNEIDGAGEHFIGSLVLPTVRLDDLVGLLREKYAGWDSILFLSVDTEGFDEQVLRGATAVLRDVMFVCVENWNDRKIALRINQLIGEDFRPAYQTALNVIYERRRAGADPLSPAESRLDH